MYTMKLSSCGNPDLCQSGPVSDPVTVTGSTLLEMRKAAYEYICFWDLGGGNWKDPVIKRGGRVVGHLSYNGCLWEGEKYVRGFKEIVVTG